jgi:ubiquitin-like modifier-activating enzyme ATG7
MPLLQFASFSSLVQPPFWHALTNIKIDVLRLSDKPLDITASYTPGRTIKDRETGADVALGCHLSIGGEAFENNAQYVFSIRLPSVLKSRSM